MTTSADFTYGVLLEENEEPYAVYGFNNEDLAQWLREETAFEEEDEEDEKSIPIPGTDNLAQVTSGSDDNDRLLALEYCGPDHRAHPWVTKISEEDAEEFIESLDSEHLFAGEVY